MTLSLSVRAESADGSTPDWITKIHVESMLVTPELSIVENHGRSVFILIDRGILYHGRCRDCGGLLHSSTVGSNIDGRLWGRRLGNQRNPGEMQNIHCSPSTRSWTASPALNIAAAARMVVLMSFSQTASLFSLLELHRQRSILQMY